MIGYLLCCGMMLATWFDGGYYDYTSNRKRILRQIVHSRIQRQSQPSLLTTRQRNEEHDAHRLQSFDFNDPVVPTVHRRN